MGVRSSVRVYVTLFIAKIVAFCGSWLRGKLSCAKHSLGRGAPWRPECLVNNNFLLGNQKLILEKLPGENDQSFLHSGIDPRHYKKGSGIRSNKTKNYTLGFDPRDNF